MFCAKAPGSLEEPAALRPWRTAEAARARISAPAARDSATLNRSPELSATAAIERLSKSE